MKVLLIGSGGREHAMAWKLSQSSKISELLIAPGNAGTSQLGENIAIGVDDHDVRMACTTANKSHSWRGDHPMKQQLNGNVSLTTYKLILY